MAATKNAKTTERISFGKIKPASETPDLLDIQLASFSDFLQLETTPDKRNNEGFSEYLKKTFQLLIPEISLYWNF
jgi:DNA-directed RNA polymerase subunit beta